MKDPILSAVTPIHRRNNRWAQRMQIGLLIAFAVGMSVHLLDRAAYGIETCKAQKLAQCPDMFA